MDVAYLALIAGYLFLASIVIKLLSFVWLLFRGYVLTSLGLVKNLRGYGKWAVVTGGSDGIGKEYARQLAQKGFDIVLISRTRSKLETVASSIENEFDVQTKIVAHDFSKCDNSGYENIEKEIKGLDIGILVNNVGMGGSKIMKYDQCSIDTVTNLLHTNVLSDLRMTHMVLKGMVERKRGLVVHIAAGAVYIDNFPFTVYAPTKIFITKFIKALQYEYHGIIDHQAVIPFGVATGMGGEILKPSLTVLTAKEYVKRAIGTIGILDYSHGCIPHEVMGFVLSSLPPRVVSFLFPIVFADFIKKIS